LPFLVRGLAHEWKRKGLLSRGAVYDDEHSRLLRWDWNARICTVLPAPSGHGKCMQRVERHMASIFFVQLQAIGKVHSLAEVNFFEHP
jgi:hypothetical protein